MQQEIKVRELAEQFFKDEIEKLNDPQRKEEVEHEEETYIGVYMKGFRAGEQHSGSIGWVKATKENMRRSAILRDSVLPENNIHQWSIRVWDDKGVLFTNKVSKDWWELEILDESGQSKEGDKEREVDAVAFAEWLLEFGYEPSFERKWVDYSKIGDNRITSARLYELFKQQNRNDEKR